MKSPTAYQRFLNGDLFICNSWIERHQHQANIEILGPPRHGKTTLVEHILLKLLDNEETPGVLHIDPTGDGYRKILGWLADGRIDRPAWLVDVDGDKILRYNPLQGAKKEPEIHVPGLYEALHLTQATESPGQHRQMQKFATATLHALIDNDLTLADAVRWLKVPGERTPRRVSNIRDGAARLDWEGEPSRNDLRSAENWFSVFAQEPLKTVFSGRGFAWDEVYDAQPIVLVNLGARRLGTSLSQRKAIAAMFVVGLFTTAFARREKRPWYAIIDDATHYTPPHIGPLLVESEGHHRLYFVLMHHTGFDGALQRAVDVGCRSKFFFGQLPRKFPSFNYAAVARYSTAQFFDETFVQMVWLDRTPDPDAEPEEVEEFKRKLYEHPWYQKAEENEPQAPPRNDRRTPSPPPPFGQQGNPKSKRPGSYQGRRGK